MTSNVRSSLFRVSTSWVPGHGTLYHCPADCTCRRRQMIPFMSHQNVVFALNREKRIHNGEPQLHGQLLGALHPVRGNTVLHIGCGTGYYSAVLAQLIGLSGKVIAYEIEPELARRAADKLKPWENVEVRAASGTEGELPRCDAIYVNAGATHPAVNWLDALNDKGRLVFPLTGVDRFGVSMLVTRLKNAFSAKPVGYCGFIDCVGATDFGRRSCCNRSVPFW